MGGGKMIFTYLFYQHIMFRKSCEKCPFTNIRRPSDITLADFWGWEKVNPELNKDDKGISLVLVNTEKGKRLFDAIKQDMNYTQVKLEDCLQPNLRHPSEPHPKRDKFEQDYAKHGFVYVAKRYGDMGWRHQVKRMYGKLHTAVKILLRQ